MVIFILGLLTGAFLVLLFFGWLSSKIDRVEKAITKLENETKEIENKILGVR
jgi:uncharacterized membrane protein YciS (DUF1049 family)